MGIGLATRPVRPTFLYGIQSIAVHTIVSVCGTECIIINAYIVFLIVV